MMMPYKGEGFSGVKWLFNMPGERGIIGTGFDNYT
jgi:hypothetical protein